MTAYGVCVGNDPNEVTAYEAWSGLTAAWVSAHGNKETTWETMGLDWVLWQLSMAKRPIVTTIPLIPKNDGATLEVGATGAYRQHHIDRAKEVLNKFSNGEVTLSGDDIHVRLGEEYNGGWYHWASKGKEKAWAGTFQQAALAIRSVSPRFKLWICPNIGQNDPMLSYPGRAYVDGFGLDFYAMDEDGADPTKAWANQCSKPYGLDWFFRTAKAENLPTAIWEWGVRADGWDAYVTAAVQRFKQEGVLFANYWMNNGDYPGDLRAYPKTAAAYSTAVKAALAPTPVTIVATSPSDYLILRVSGDSYQGDPQFTVKVDGTQIGGTLTTAASHAAGKYEDKILVGPFTAGPHSVEVTFLNDAWGGASNDRNFYVHSLAFSQPSVAGAPLYNTGSVTFKTP